MMKYFKGPPSYWNADDIEGNVLSMYSPNGIKATVFDPKSIMLYAFDGALFSDGKGPTKKNTVLLALDRQMIGKIYPT